MIRLRFVERLTLKKGHRWFAAEDPQADSWFGPSKSMEEAILLFLEDNKDWNDSSIFVAQGRRATKAEKEEWGYPHDWVCTSNETLEVTLPKRR